MHGNHVVCLAIARLGAFIVFVVFSALGVFGSALVTACGDSAGTSAVDATAPRDSTGADAAPDTSTVQFVQVSRAAGLDSPHWQPPPLPEDSPCWKLDLMTGGAAAADYDADGYIDIFYTRLGLPNQLFRNRGDGTFEDVAPTLGLDHVGGSNGASWADVDGDGDLDLYVTMIWPEGNRLYIQYSDSDSAWFTDETGARNAAIPVTRPGVCMATQSASFGDADGDGDLDLLVGGWAPPSVPMDNRLLVNDGAGYFSDGTSLAGLGDIRTMAAFTPAFADADNDGITDILYVGDWQTSHHYRGTASGRFIDITESSGAGTDENGMGSALGDYDNDGDIDWFITSIWLDPLLCQAVGGHCAGNRLFTNDGAGQFSDTTLEAGVANGGWGWGAAFFDYDNDGDLDLGMAAGYDTPWDNIAEPHNQEAFEFFAQDPLRLWRNDGGAGFVEVADAVGMSDPGPGKAFIPLDYDRDGDLDVFVTNTLGAPLLFENQGAPAGSWLTVRLRGRAPNTAALGARVEARAHPTAATQRRDISNNSTFLGHGPAEAYFGFGPDVERIDELSVRWPDGSVTTLADVALGRVLTIDSP